MTEHIRQTQESQKHIAASEYEADSKVTGAHRKIDRCHTAYGGDDISCDIRKWSDRLGKKVVA